LELFFRFFVPERVEESHAAGKRLLYGRIAGNREADGAQLRSVQVFVVGMAAFVIGWRGKISVKRRAAICFIAYPADKRV